MPSTPADPAVSSKIVAKSVSGGEAGLTAVEIIVTDNGIGISAAGLARVFEPFFTTKKDVGTGLGLWVVKQIVEGSKGRVSIESSIDSENHGTSVKLYLPEVEETEPSPLRRQPQPPETTAFGFEGTRVSVRRNSVFSF